MNGFKIDGFLLMLEYGFFREKKYGWKKGFGVFVKGLIKRMRKKDLLIFFEMFWKVSKIKVMNNEHIFLPFGVAFIVFNHSERARRVVEALNGKKLSISCGRLTVKIQNK
jgi:hypothetical protein